MSDPNKVVVADEIICSAEFGGAGCIVPEDASDDEEAE